MSFNNQKTILLVEDEVLLALDGKISLEKYGYSVITANNGEKAVSLALNNEKINIILMDIDLGRGIDGTQAARQILTKRNIPIVFLTSHIEKEYVDMVKEITRYGYVVKNSGDFVLQSSIEMAFQLFEANMKVVESEEIQKAMISNISDVIGIIEPGGKIKYKSPNFEKLFGWPPQSVIGLDIQFLLNPDESDEIKTELLALLKTVNSTKILECRLKCKDGSYKLIELTATNLINDPHIKGILINFHDISLHKMAEDALVESENRYRRLHESITDSFVQVLMTGEIVNVNRSFLEMLGYTKEEAFSLTYNDITPAKWHEYEKEIIETQVLPNGYSQVYEKEYIRKDGLIFPVELRTYLLKGNDGMPSGMWAIISDITDRKNAEKALRESEERFRSLLESVPTVAVQGYSMDGKTNYWNKASERFYGYTEEEAIDKNLLDLIIPPEMRGEVEKAIRYMADTGDPIPSAELSLMRKDKSLVSVYSSHSIVKIPGREPELFCIDIDLSERKKAEETLSNERNLLRTLIDNLPESVQVYIKDTQSRYIINNRAHLKTLGASSQEEVYGKTSLDFFATGLAKDFLADDVEIFRSGIPLIEKDERVYNFTLGEERWHSTTKVPFRNSEGVIVGLVGMTSDITERKLSDKIIRESEERFRFSMEATNDGLWDWDIRTNEGYFNPAFFKMLGYEPDSFPVKGEFWVNMMHPDDVVHTNRAYTDCIEGRYDSFEVEYRMRAKDGSWSWILGRVKSIARDDNGFAVRLLGTHMDITGRKNMEAALRESEEKYRAWIDNLGEGLGFVNQNEEFIFSNSVGNDIFGVSPGSLVGRNLAEFMTPHQVEIIRKQTGKRRSGEKNTYEIEICRPNGQKRILIITGVPHFDTSGKFLGTFGVFRDLTENKQAVKELQRSEEELKRQNGLFESLLKNLPIGVIMVDTPSGRPLVVNNEANKLFGRGVLSERSDSNFDEVYNARKFGTSSPYPPEEMPIILGMCGQSSHVDDIVVKNPDGTETFLEVFGSPVTNEYGQIWASLASFIDITERKKAEEALQEVEAKYREMIEQSLDGIIISDEAGNVAVWNKSMENITGILSLDAIGSTIWDITFRILPNEKKNPELYEKQKKVITGILNRSIDFPGRTSDQELITVDGSRKIILETSFLIKSKSSIRIGSIIRDITDRKLSEQKINNLLKEKELILKEVHHRIKNNMNTMVGLLTLQAGILKDPEAIAAFKDSSSRIRSMMVLYDKLYRSNNFGELVIKEYLSELVDEIVNMFPHDKILKIEKQVEDFNLSVNTVFSLGIIVNELLTNVIKYAFVGRNEGWIYVSASKKENLVTFILQDNGVGLPESVDFNNSSGFGMQLVALLTEQIEGTIKIERTNGTKFILQFEV